MTPTEFMFNIHRSAVCKPYPPITIAETGKRIAPVIIHRGIGDATAVWIGELEKFIFIFLLILFFAILTFLNKYIILEQETDRDSMLKCKKNMKRDA